MRYVYCHFKNIQKKGRNFDPSLTFLYFTGQVFVYHKAFPMPVLSYKFKTIDPLSDLEVDDASQFISSVSWRGQSSTLVSANSTGNIKILEMV